MVLSERSLELYTLQAEPTTPTFPPYVMFLYFPLSPFPRNGRLCQLLALCLKCHRQKSWTGFHEQQQQQYQTIKNISSISRLPDFCQNDAHSISVKRMEGGELAAETCKGTATESQQNHHLLQVIETSFRSV